MHHKCRLCAVEEHTALYALKKHSKCKRSLLLAKKCRLNVFAILFTLASFRNNFEKCQDSFAKSSREAGTPGLLLAKAMPLI